jgi:hypothetical protein
MYDDPDPGIDTDAWFKELPNRLDRLGAWLGDLETRIGRAMRVNGHVPEPLSLVQELIAKIEDSVATLLADADGQRAEPRADPSREPIVYRDVPGFPGYRVGTDGTVWGSRRAGRGYGRSREWRQLKPYLVRPGPAPTVSLYRDRVRHSMRVNALVLLTFVGERPDGHDVGNLNGDCLDNRLENLCYVPTRTSDGDAS